MSPSPSPILFAFLSLVLTGTPPVSEAPHGGREPIPPAWSRDRSLPADKFDLTRTGIPWIEGLPRALGRGKPILLFQLLGRFDDALC